MDTASRVCYEFGPFRIDPDREVMLRDGQPVAITPKAFEVLLQLVRRDREVLSKDELLQAVWPGRIVEEANLSQCIFLLRKLLGDTCEERRYIVTLPGRGYRFAAPVRVVLPDAGNDVSMRRQPVAAVAAQQAAVIAAGSGGPPIAGARRRFRKWWLALPAGVAVIALSGGLVFFLHGHASPHVTLRVSDPVVVADFANTTGDPVFDDTLQQGLAVQLQQSPTLSLISQDRIQQTLRRMQQPANAALTPALAREVCERTASAVVLDGSIARLGSAYVLGLQARDCDTGEVLDEEQAQAARKEDVLQALDTIAGNFRNHVGESLAAIARHNVPLAEATTSSLEALKAYSEAWKVHYASGPVAAIPLFQRAIAVDPQFAMAHASLGRMYGDLGAVDLSARSTRTAWQLREHTSDQERYFIDASYQLQVTGNLLTAQQVCEAWMRAYPATVIPRAFLAGIIYPVAGERRKALAQARQVVALDPDFVVGYVVLAYAYTDLGAFPDAVATLHRAAQRGLAMPDLTALGYDLAFLRSDPAGMARAAANLDIADVRDWMLYHQALALGYTGRLREARALSQQAIALATQASRPERAALFASGDALIEAFYGDATIARQDAEQALGLSNERDAEFGAAMALAMSGSTAQAGKLADDLETRYPDDTSVRFSYLPALRAQLALDQGQPDKAIELLQVAAPYDQGHPRSSMHGMFGAMYTVYTRGEAYLAEHRGAQAAAEFRTIVEHPGIIISDPVGALARLQLARAYRMQGDTGKAKAAYADLRNLWKSADEELPAVKAADNEDSRLR
ncbi:MAG: hypothetical protein OJF55_000479 [Rhodanobacteraceae bacterium]|jgi:DNA-binding winged helix-turn-helix (wHTH) protein/tetratricopeptide (TPR) repeat protein|nr:MAG: hypothetical protein OJF55_000479 [Rhodanobacteraceae bacterium]